MRSGHTPDGAALIRAKRASAQRFSAAVNALRKRGFSDRDIVEAMVGSSALVDAVGRPPPRARRSNAVRRSP